MNGEVVADHVWVMGVTHWHKHKEEVGKQVEFNAIVRPYSDGSVTNYNLVNPDELVFLHEPPALTIPDPPDDETISVSEPSEDSQPEPEVSLQAMRQAKTLAKVCGGFDEAERFVEAMQNVTIPLPQLLEWIRALKE